jgi:hypothetical protein
MKKNKILAGLSALVMGATMMAGTAMSASAAEYGIESSNISISMNRYASYNEAHFYTNNGNLAPFGMDDGCFASVSTDPSTGDTTIVLQPYTWLGITGTIISVKTTDGTELVNSAGTAIVIPASLGNSFTVFVTFGGSLATAINYIPGMTNPMMCTLTLS